MNSVIFRLLPLLLLIVLLDSCAFRRVRRSKGLVYQEAAAKMPEQELNVFAPRRSPRPAPVLIFIHGGNWSSGRKELYSWFGSRMARKGIVTVIIDHPLSPDADFRDMAGASARAYRWVETNIARYGGNPDSIFISGHSSGGHLAALIGVDADWLRKAGVRKGPAGLILIDAAGLNMAGYLQAGGLDDNPTYPATFGTDPGGWKAATPLLQLHAGVPPMLILTGGRSYPSITGSSEAFAAALKARNLSCRYILQPRRKHVPMITQFFNTANPRYRDIRRFLVSGTP